MAVKVNLPKWGMGLEEGTVLRWLKAEGATIKKGDPLVEIETAKTTQEVVAPASGVLARILVVEGETAPVNTELAVIEENDG